ncbi:MAG TPA: hypothetical protein PLR39_02405, partial [Treponemataceae bacterium]|nr:hypothetical protein [Treponemataceae bacterium]
AGGAAGNLEDRRITIEYSSCFFDVPHGNQLRWNSAVNLMRECESQEGLKHGAAGEQTKKHGCFFVYDERTKAHRIRFKLTMSTLSRECVML